MYDGFGELPGFTVVKQNGLYIGIEDPGFSGKTINPVVFHI